MYERSAIVLERYFNYLFGFQKEYNLKTNYQNFISLVDELQKYQAIVIEEEQVIKVFDEVAKKIQEIQKKQEKISNANVKLEEDRGKLFNNLEESPSLIEKKFIKLETSIDNNNEQLKSLKEQFVEALKQFVDKQIERNKCSRTRRVVETNHVSFVKQVTEELQEIDVAEVKKVKAFLTTTDDNNIQKELIASMMDNGKSEKVKFSKEVIEKAVIARIDIAKKEAEAYLLAYDKMRRMLSEIESDNFKLSKYQKTCRDLSVKFAFLEAEKEYIVAFLDNERMTAINGDNTHKKMMEEACEKFDLDSVQIKNLYELILREVAGKSTKKAYNELYNKTYLKEIEEKEKNFEEEVNNVRIQGTIINSNYWRIEGIKNLYEVFQKEVSEKFEKDLSEYRIDEQEEKEELFNESGDVLEDELLEENIKFDNEINDESEELEEHDDIEMDENEYEDDEDNEYDEDNEDVEIEDLEELDDEYDTDEYNEDEDLEDDVDEEYEDDSEYDESEEIEEDEEEYYDEDEDVDKEYEYEDDDEIDAEVQDDEEQEEIEDSDEEEYYDDSAEKYDDEYDDEYDIYEWDNEYEEDNDEDEENYEPKEKRKKSRNKKVKNIQDRSIDAKSKRGNIDDRLAVYKEKMKEEKQSRGFFNFFKDRK